MHGSIALLSVQPLWVYPDAMSERSQLLKAMSAAYALGDRAIPCNRDRQQNPVTADLDDPARALAALARYAASHPGDPMSDEIRQAYDLLARLLAATHLPRTPIT